MQETTDTQKSFGVSLIIGLLVATVLNIVTGTSDSMTLFHLSNGQSVAIIVTFFLSSTLCFLVSDTGNHRLKLLSLSILYGAILSVLSICSPNMVTASSITLLCFGTYAGLCLIQSYHQAHYTQPDYTIFFSSVWNIFCMCLLSGVFLGFVYILVAICATIFSIFKLSLLISIVKSAPFHLTLVPVTLSIGYYVTSRWTKLVYSTRMILLEFIKILLPIFSVITWFLIILIITHSLFNTQINLSHESISNFSLCLSLYGLFSINAVYMDGSALDRLSKRYRQSLLALCLATPCLLLSSLFFTIANTNSPIINHHTIALFALILLAMLYALSYIYAALKTSSQWMFSLQNANVKLAWVLMALGIIINLPILQWLPKANITDLDRLTHTQKKDPATLAKERNQQTKKDMATIGLSWKNKDDTTPTVLGYRYNQALNACKPSDGNIPIGIIINAQCQVINKQNHIVSHKDYLVLSGHSKKIQWGQYPVLALHFYNPLATYRYNVCRTIINNRVYIGIMQLSINSNLHASSVCQCIVDNKVVNKINFNIFGT